MTSSWIDTPVDDAWVRIGYLGFNTSQQEGMIRMDQGSGEPPVRLEDVPVCASATVSAAGAPLLRIRRGTGPVVAVALHSGHELRSELHEYVAVTKHERLREEDPWTARMAPSGTTLIEVLRSRFEVDLNRPRSRAIYGGPEDAWGLEVYRRELPLTVDHVSRGVYDAFYSAAFDTLSTIAAEHGRFVVFDLHSYNHRRDGATAPAAPAAHNPEVNLGTGWIDRDRWAPVVDRFLASMHEAGFDCRENVKFRGGHFARWVADAFPDNGAVLAIEFKKTYMDEWTGVVDETAVERIRLALEAAVRVVAAELAATL